MCRIISDRPVGLAVCNKCIEIEENQVCLFVCSVSICVCISVECLSGLCNVCQLVHTCSVCVRVCACMRVCVHACVCALCVLSVCMYVM